MSAQGPSVKPRGVASRVDEPDYVDWSLVLQSIRCRLGGRTVLDIDRVTFPAGRVSAIRGVKGAGKSTLARIIAGLQACGGTVSMGDRSLSRKRRLRQSAIVMQDVQRQLFTESVMAEIELADTGATNAPDLREVLSALGLTDLSQRHPLALSGGQQQRLVVAACVAGRRIVVFGEPSSGVDRRHLTSIAEEIRAVAAGAVVLLISDDEYRLALAADAELTLCALD
ncbi:MULTISPECIES: ATP-binding cassette domain-containing protein [Brevibacterium]|uniref:ATP-binding cassette domain-containing protein n=1 Tax=Brevibacterium TaxID=1696 RepID=UPI0027E33106|nr:ATP-binding cassette domain-containing protein [Brevibacterium aurantiacum]